MDAKRALVRESSIAASKDWPNQQISLYLFVRRTLRSRRASLDARRIAVALIFLCAMIGWIQAPTNLT